MRRGWQVALSAVLSLLMVGVVLLAVSGCARSCSRIEWTRALEALSRRAEQMGAGVADAAPENAGPTAQTDGAQPQRDVSLRP